MRVAIPSDRFNPAKPRSHEYLVRDSHHMSRDGALYIKIKIQILSRPPTSASTMLTGILAFRTNSCNKFSVVSDCRELRMLDGAHKVFGMPTLLFKGR